MLKKKSVSVIIFFFLYLVFLSGCVDNQNDKSFESQSKTIQSLKIENSSLKNEVSNNIKGIKKGETVDLSGIIEIGKDLYPGLYDIQLLSNKEHIFHYYANEQAFEKKDSREELLIPNENGEDTNIRKNYVLKKGNIIETDTTLRFLRKK